VESPNAKLKTETKGDLAAAPKNDVRKGSDQSAAEPEKKTTSHVPKTPANPNVVLAFDLQDGAADKPQTVDLKPPWQPDSPITELDMIPLGIIEKKSGTKKKDSSKEKSQDLPERPYVKKGTANPKSLELIVNGFDSNTGIGKTPVPFAHFESKGERVEFGWAPYGLSHEELKPLLRNWVLKMKAANGETRYALAGPAPKAIADPLSLSEYEQTDVRTWYKGNGKSMTKKLSWSKKKEFDYLKYNLTIMKISTPSLKSNTKLEYTKDPKDPQQLDWECKGPNGAVIMKVGFVPSENQIKFTFIRPDRSKRADGAPDDTGANLKEELIAAEHSLILGLKIDDQLIELVRIGKFPTE